MKNDKMMIGMLVRGLRTSLDNPKIIVDGKRYGQNVYLLMTDTDMTQFGFADGSQWGGANSYFLGLGLESAYMKIVEIVRDHTEKETKRKLVAEVKNIEFRSNDEAA